MNLLDYKTYVEFRGSRPTANRTPGWRKYWPSITIISEDKFYFFRILYLHHDVWGISEELSAIRKRFGILSRIQILFFQRVRLYSANDKHVLIRAISKESFPKKYIKRFTDTSPGIKMVRPIMK